jgi:two-component system sensor histidine kinase KdpD
MMRLESGAIELKREWVEIGEVIGTALSRLTRLLGQHQLSVEVEPDLPMLRLDFVLVEHVLVNLLENAAKYSPPQTTIRVRARREGESIALEIADQGIGIPAAERERIFDKFYRVQRGDRQGAGTGLGLSICRGIVEAHGGQIAARSPANGKGTVFAVTFPLEKETPAMADR